jgi:alpha-amylase
MKGYSVLNYLSSHDDGQPFDALRQRPYETANKLLLAPGAAQIYYGDETARLLKVEGAEGDATLRSFMNWDELASNAQRGVNRVRDVREHWARLGRFRQAHPAVGAGVHRMIQQLSLHLQAHLRARRRGRPRGGRARPAARTSRPRSW